MLIIKKNVLMILCITVATVFWTSCGLVGSLSTETRSEKKTTAEFKLSETEGKIAVIVSQPAWIKTPEDLRIALTNSINKSLEEKAKIKKDRLIPYTEVLNARMALADEKRNDLFAIASKLDANCVLAVEITDFELSTFAEEDFYNGLMAAKSSLFDIAGNKLWPSDANEAGRETTVNIEAEKGTVQSAVGILSAATAHCITRYLYDCKTMNFRIEEEQKELDYYDDW